MPARDALIRFLLFIVVLPLVIAVLLPLWLASRYDVTLAWAGTWWAVLIQVAGAAVLLLGATLVVSALYQIAVRRQTALAPWDLPRQLVIRGPYRRVRNPMISGVLFALIGEAMLLLSLPHALFALAFFLLSVTYIPLLEEPQIEARFGEEYRRYRRNVSRLLPRLRPWNPEA